MKSGEWFPDISKNHIMFESASRAGYGKVVSSNYPKLESQIMSEAVLNKYVPVQEKSRNSVHTLNKENLIRFAMIAFELALILLVIYLFRIEREHGLVQMVPCIFGGFVIYHFIPARFRLPFFCLLSVFAYLLVLGTTNGLILLGLGLALIGLCHVPISFWLRILAIVAVTALFAAMRLNLISATWSTVVVPMIASMFMFRLILYLYELRQAKQEPATVWHRISYFFLLPNVCFPFFPIVDYRNYVRNYWNDDPLTISQKGINWMFMGISQLLLYRIIYTYYAIGPAEVIDTNSLLVYLATSYAILIKLSGQAHFIIGLLCLFGFNLPRVFDNYFLATGPSDYWRRINVYWKDFVMRVFYYPFYFRVKRLGVFRATIFSLVVIFLITAVLHAYQFFWLQGNFRLTLIDALFWGVLGVLVIVNAALQMKEKKRMKPRDLTFLLALKRSFQILLFFVFMSVLWSIWKSSSIHEWISLFLVVRKSTAMEIGIILLSLAAAGFTGAILHKVVYWMRKQEFVNQQSFYRTAVLVSLCLCTTVVLRMNRYYVPKYSKLETFITSIRADKLNTSDAENLERGYYENIMNSNRITVESVSVGKLKPLDWVELHETNAVRFTNDLLMYEPLPNMHIRFKNEPLSTNEWGMRDKSYSLQKPKGQYRFILLGGSYEMGSGVTDEETFESRLEKRLNQEHGQRYEVLNFAVGGYGIERIVKVVDTKIFRFQPDAVLYVAHTRERERSVTAFLRIIEAGVNPEYDFLREVVQKSGVRKDMSFVEAKRALLPFADEILEWSYTRIANQCRQHGAIPVWIFLPTLEGRTAIEETQKLLAFAKKLGFVTIDLTKVYGNNDLEELQCAAWDTHPGPKAHQLIADLLYKKIIKNHHSLNLGLPVAQQRMKPLNQQ
jgi:D-alanyl-lipoteichoic acid acyltransferase DltB (MBOAT superfamily)